MISQYDQLPVGLIAQLVEHRFRIAVEMGSNSVHASLNFFFRISFRNSYGYRIPLEVTRVQAM